MDLYQQTLVLIKPHAIDRNLTGRIIHRLEDNGLRLKKVASRYVDSKTAERQYTHDDDWKSRIGRKTIELSKTYDLTEEQIVQIYGTSIEEEIGQQIQNWSIESLAEQNVVMAVFEGIHAIDVVKNIVGETEPVYSERGTIRGDWALDSAIYANSKGRAVHNLVHRSSNLEEAAREIGIWFGKI